MGARILLACAAAASVAAPAAAQAPPVSAEHEVRLIRDAELRERAGDFEAAAALLGRILAERPSSLPALLGLERVLRQQGRLAELPPVVERFLREDAKSAIAHQVLVRTYSALDDVAGLERASERWLRESPRLETPYREMARLWESRGEPERAIAVLERGRSRINRDDALALELGALYGGQGDLARAAREWDRAIGPEARGFLLVRRRLAQLPDGGAQLLPALIDGLIRRPTSPPRRRAAVDLAIDAGLAEKAESIAAPLAQAMSGGERQGFLVEVARRADGAHLPGLAYWAYSEFLAGEGPTEQMLAVRSRVADLALVVGDTARARRYYEELEAAYATGSAARREAVGKRIALIAHEGRLDEALEDYRAFKTEFGDVPEAAELAATLAALLLVRGDADGADRMVRGLGGARANLVRGRIELRRGEVAAARMAFLAAAPELTGAEATETIALASLLGRLSTPGGALLGMAMAEAGAGKAHEAVMRLLSGSEPLPGSERAPILEFAAGLADRHGLAAEAEVIRRTLIAEHPAAREVPAALLALARQLMERDGAGEEARELLERLVIDHPRSALAPQARRELDRLRARRPHS